MLCPNTQSFHELNDKHIFMAGISWKKKIGQLNSNLGFGNKVQDVNTHAHQQSVDDSEMVLDYFTSIYHSIVDLIVVFDEHNIILEVNDILEQKLGFSRHELIGKSIDQLTSTKYATLFTKFSSEVRLHKKATNFEIDLTTKDGGNLAVSCSASIMSGGIKTKSQVLLLAKDISELKKTQRDLEAKNKELDTFVYRTSHDLMGPIASILGVAELSKKDLEDPTARDYMQMVDSCASRIKSILIELNELARMRNTPMCVDEINLEVLCDQLCEKLIAEKNLSAVSVIKNFRHTIKLRSNGKLIASILLAVIDNALTYRKINFSAESEIRLSTRDKDSGITILVRDNGMGIAQHLVGRVMDMFERATEASKGAGLGLYIAKTSIERLGGAIKIESEEKEFTEVSLWIPSLHEDSI